MKRTAFLLTFGAALLSLVLCGTRAENGQEPAEELRFLQAENALLKVTAEQRDKTIESLKKEIEKLKAENARVGALLKQAGITPEKADAPSTLPDAPKAASTEANKAVAKAFVEYAEKGKETATSNGTDAQKEAAYAKAVAELASVLGRQRVTITYTVKNVRIADDNTALLWTESGAIKSSVPNVPDVKIGVLTVRVNVPRATALQIKKGSPFTLTGMLFVQCGHSDVRTLTGYTALQLELPLRTQRGTPPGPRTYLTMTPPVPQTYLTIRNDYTANLDGRDVTVVQSGSQ